MLSFIPIPERVRISEAPGVYTVRLRNDTCLSQLKYKYHPKSFRRILTRNFLVRLKMSHSCYPFPPPKTSYEFDFTKDEDKVFKGRDGRLYRRSTVQEFLDHHVPRIYSYRDYATPQEFRKRPNLKGDDFEARNEAAYKDFMYHFYQRAGPRQQRYIGSKEQSQLPSYLTSNYQLVNVDPKSKTTEGFKRVDTSVFQNKYGKTIAPTYYKDPYVDRPKTRIKIFGQLKNKKKQSADSYIQ